MIPNYVLAALLTMVSGTTVSNPGIVIAGDSIPQFSHNTISTSSAWTVERDTNGLVTLTKANHNIFGDGKIFVTAMTDPTLNGLFNGHIHTNGIYYYQTAVTGSVIAPSTTICAAAQITQMSVQQTRGIALHLMNQAGGGMRYQGAFVQGGMFAKDMIPNVTMAAAAADFGVVLICGTNDNKGNQTTAQTIASVKALINLVVYGNTAGTGSPTGKKVFWSHITPLGTTFVTGLGYSAYNDQAKIINLAIDNFVDNVNSYTFASFTPLLNVATNAAYDYATFDSIHWTPWTSRTIAILAWAKIAPLVTVGRLLPTGSGGTLGIPFATSLRDRGIWTTPTVAQPPNTGASHMAALGTPFATSATLQTGLPAASNSGAYALVSQSGVAGVYPANLYHSDGTTWATNNAYTGNDSVVFGSIPSGWSAGRSAGTGTVVVGVVADTSGSSNGLAVKGLFSAAAVGDIISIWPDTSSGVSLSVGANWAGGVVPPAGTRFKISALVTWAGITATGTLTSIRMFVPSQTSGLYFTSIAGDDPAEILPNINAYMGDSGSILLETGVSVLPSIDTAPTSLFPAVQVRFNSGATTTPLQVLIQNVQYVAVTDSTVV